MQNACMRGDCPVNQKGQIWTVAHPTQIWKFKFTFYSINIYILCSKMRNWESIVFNGLGEVSRSWSVVWGDCSITTVQQANCIVGNGASVFIGTAFLQTSPLPLLLSPNNESRNITSTQIWHVEGKCVRTILNLRCLSRCVKRLANWSGTWHHRSVIRVTHITEVH